MEGEVIGGGRWCLHSKLGEGGCGQVWLAEDLTLSDWVAVKFLPTALRGDAAGLVEMAQEVAKARRMSHPNIVRMDNLHYSEDEDFPFVTMEYVAGSTLGDLRKAQPEEFFAWETLKPLALQLCDALECAHAENVIHRDLKPANVLVTEEGVVKLMDFGISEVVSTSMSRMTGKIGLSGTPHYMSPQQVEGRTPNRSDDIYSFGSTLYHLLTGKPVFLTEGAAGTVSVLMRRIRMEDASSISSRLAELNIRNPVPEHVEAVIMKCLSRERELRPVNMREVKDALGAEPVVAVVEPVRPRKVVVARKVDPVAALKTFNVEGWQRRLRWGIRSFSIGVALLLTLAITDCRLETWRRDIDLPKGVPGSDEDKGKNGEWLRYVYLRCGYSWNFQSRQNRYGNKIRSEIEPVDVLSFDRSLGDAYRGRTGNFEAHNGAMIGLVTNAHYDALELPHLLALNYDRTTMEFGQLSSNYVFALRIRPETYAKFTIEQGKQFPRLRYIVYANSVQSSPLDKVTSTATAAPDQVVFPELKKLPAGIEARSLASRHETTVRFFNRSGTPKALSWIHFDGSEKSYGQVAPGGMRSLQTFASHVWLVRGEGGTMLGKFRAGQATGRVFIDGNSAAVDKALEEEAAATAAAVAAKKGAEVDARLLASQTSRAKSGSASAQYDLALRYLEGTGVEQDEADGMRLLKLSAAQGYLLATGKLAGLQAETKRE